MSRKPASSLNRTDHRSDGHRFLDRQKVIAFVRPNVTQQRAAKLYSIHGASITRWQDKQLSPLNQQRQLPSEATKTAHST